MIEGKPAPALLAGFTAIARNGQADFNESRLVFGKVAWRPEAGMLRLNPAGNQPALRIIDMRDQRGRTLFAFDHVEVTAPKDDKLVIHLVAGSNEAGKGEQQAGVILDGELNITLHIDPRNDTLQLNVQALRLRIQDEANSRVRIQDEANSGGVIQMEQVEIRIDLNRLQNTDGALKLPTTTQPAEPPRVE